MTGEALVADIPTAPILTESGKTLLVYVAVADVVSHTLGGDEVAVLGTSVSTGDSIIEVSGIVDCSAKGDCGSTEVAVIADEAVVAELAILLNPTEPAKLLKLAQASEAVVSSQLIAASYL